MTRWCSGDNQSVGSSVPVVSRWLWPGNRIFLEVASMVDSGFFLHNVKQLLIVCLKYFGWVHGALQMGQAHEAVHKEIQPLTQLICNVIAVRSEFVQCNITEMNCNGSCRYMSVRKSLMATWLEQASQWHEMYCRDLDVMSSNPGWVKLGVRSTSV